MKPAFLWVLYYIQNNTNKCSYFCLTSGVTVWYNAKCIKQNARIGERNERSGLFPLPYAVCYCSANMALTDMIGWRRIGRKGGILQNKKRYPSKLRPLGAASRFSCSGNAVALPRLATTGCEEQQFACAVTWGKLSSAEAVITVYNGRLFAACGGVY